MTAEGSPAPPVFAEDAQRDIEARAADLRGRVERGEVAPDEANGTVEDWLLEIEGHSLALVPSADEWIYLDPVHETWERTGCRSGEVLFAVADGELVARHREEPPPPAPTAPVLRFCGRCGAPADPGGRFCGSCGAPHQTSP